MMIPVFYFFVTSLPFVSKSPELDPALRLVLMSEIEAIQPCLIPKATAI